MSLKSINPFDGTLIGEFEEISDQSLSEILDRSSVAFQVWRRADTGMRSLFMRNMAGILTSNAGDYSRAITLEMGKPLAESKAEVEKCAWVCNYYAENAAGFLKDEKIATDAWTSYVSYEPLGTILGIMPWNFPFWQVFRFAVPAVMAGNTVILKHASNVQLCARLIGEIFSEAGFPSGIFSNVVTGSSRVSKILEHEAVRGVSLTGSEIAGQSVAEIAGRNIKKSLLELGGSNAFIVLPDADISQAAETGAKARMMNAGQSCIAAKRFIIHKDISDRFIKLLAGQIEKLIMGDPMDPATTIGPLASVMQAETVESQVNESVRMGAEILTGGVRKGAFYTPTILLNVKPGMPVFDEEVFGPVAPVMEVESAEEAMTLAGLSKYGLGVSLFTSDLEKAMEMARDFKDGAVFINELVKSDPRLPFGGTGKSGYGRELALHGIREFVNVKTVFVKKI